MELSRRFKGKKFMWEGRAYQNGGGAQVRALNYVAEGFQVEVVEEAGQFYIFTRREVKERPPEEKPQ